MKALLWNNPRVPYLVRLECRGLEEVKSTVQARYTTTYIVYEGMFVRHKHMTYPTRDDPRNES